MEKRLLRSYNMDVNNLSHVFFNIVKGGLKYMQERRYDDKGRLLHPGEMQMPDGRYRYKYADLNGDYKVIYSWRLSSNDRVPKGKKKGISLREYEKQIQFELMSGISTEGMNMTVYDLAEKYVQTKTNVRKNTKAGYGTVLNILRKDTFGKKKINSVRISDAKSWLIKLQNKDGRSYSSINSIRGVLKPAFQMAFDDDLIRKNPFNFPVVEVIVNDSVTRESITRDEERRFLKFVKEDHHFCGYYDGFYILFKTGMRISEFCGLTLDDLDFKNHTINIQRQLQKRGSEGYYIMPTKTSAGTRIIPMSDDVEKCFKHMIQERPKFKKEPIVDGVSGFLSFDKNGSIEYSLHWNKHMHYAVEKYNRIYKKELPNITPHVCRHTYCSNMAKAGMNPKTLQYLMGHSDISVTMNTYTHVKLEDAQEELARLKHEKNARFKS